MIDPAVRWDLIGKVVHAAGNDALRTIALMKLLEGFDSRDEGQLYRCIAEFGLTAMISVALREGIVKRDQVPDAVTRACLKIHTTVVEAAREAWDLAAEERAKKEGGDG